MGRGTSKTNYATPSVEHRGGEHRVAGEGLAQLANARLDVRIIEPFPSRGAPTGKNWLVRSRPKGS